MEIMENTATTTAQEETDQFDKNFKPSGAIAFFITLVSLGLLIWFAIYFLMLERA
jgi:hypothetical protein